MYDPSLEQLIDAVIADGVITDQERNVVYKKAASLGIDQDEIEVYLNGCLDKINSAKPKSNKKGELKTCPHCGANLGSFVGKCSECGHEIIGVESNHSAKEFFAKVEVIKNKKRKFLDDGESNEMGSLIQNFPIPNTKDDFIEFGTLCLTGMKTDDATSEAWINKSTQIIAKGQMLFGNDPDINNLISSLQEGVKTTKKSKRKSELSVLFILIGFICVCLTPLIFLCNSEDEYMQDMLEQINNLPTPTAENYLDCYRQFSAITWTESTGTNEYEAFEKAQNSYKEILLAAFRSADVPDDQIPPSLLTSSDDDKDSSVKSKKEKEELEESSDEEIVEVDVVEAPVADDLEL